jgi:hypothetical protein
MIQEGGTRICTYMRSEVWSVWKRDKGPMAGRKYVLGSGNGVQSPERQPEMSPESGEVGISLQTRDRTICGCGLSYYRGTTFWQILSISFVLTQFLTFLSPEYSGLFPKHLIHSLIILLHQNLWMDCYVSVKQVLGPPFDKMSHSVTAWQVCQIPQVQQQNGINEAHIDALVRVWTCLANVMPSNAAVSANSNTSVT